uniref:Uncharacterized protein n=1 Tax=Moniliophthora roreri TaxID=221103 RepID=A0A0W0F2V4_MONRR
MPFKDELLAEYNPDQNIPDIDNNLGVSNHKDLDSSDKDTSSNKNVMEPAKAPSCPAYPSLIVEVPT